MTPTDQISTPQLDLVSLIEKTRRHNSHLRGRRQALGRSSVIVSLTQRVEFDLSQKQ